MMRDPGSGGADLPPAVCRTLELLARGLSTDEAACRLACPPEIVRRHLAEAILALGATSKLDAIVRALALELIDPFGADSSAPGDGRPPNA